MIDADGTVAQLVKASAQRVANSRRKLIGGPWLGLDCSYSVAHLFADHGFGSDHAFGGFEGVVGVLRLFLSDLRDLFGVARYVVFMMGVGERSKDGDEPHEGAEKAPVGAQEGHDGQEGHLCTRVGCFRIAAGS